jgi:hypothetical protein
MMDGESSRDFPHGSVALDFRSENLIQVLRSPPAYDFLASWRMLEKTALKNYRIF